ncbi:MAG: 4'-phosphopantetheinyl transferase superfamily protein [Sphingobacteriales bacterium]|nr:MAG: 4'-phosphopantetheinyl transferase superfamily protein [Sphingobacteriales bacterium]
MPLYKEIEVDANSRLAIWQIDEDAADLKWELQWGQEDIKRFSALNDEQRSMHWLCSRVLLRKMLNTSKFIDLQVDEFGKPYLKNIDLKLSISHSGKFVTVLLSNKDCGVDIQEIEPNIERVAKKFISTEEWENIGEDDRLDIIHVFWSAKEALYKFYGKRKIDFRTHLTLYPFRFAEKGVVTGRIEKDKYSKELPVYYRKIENYILAYTVAK